MSRQSNTDLPASSSADFISPGERELVRSALGDLLASQPFRSSLQCRSFLSYVVEHTLSGDDSSLRERVIGFSVFGRRPDYDTGDDPVVRIRAAEVRKRLAQYYQSLHRQPGVVIQIPAGSYRASFQWEKQTAKSPVPSSATAVPEPIPGTVSEILKPSVPVLDPEPLTAAISAADAKMAAPPQIHSEMGSSRRHRTFAAVLLAVLAILVLSGWFWHRHAAQPDRELRAFWQPFLANSKPVLISVGSNAVYRISEDTADRYSQEHHLESNGMEFFPDFSPDATIRSSGLHPAPDSFVALGDVAAVSHAVAALTRFNRPFQERFSNDISFAELRSNPTLLVGGFNNPMTRELTRNFRFVFLSRNRIEDRQNPGKSWILHASSDSHDTEDFAVISRVLPKQEDSAPLVSVAGLGQYGTLAATDFVFNPESIRSLDRRAPGDWKKRNMQILLRIKVSDFKAVATDVVAIHLW